MDHKIKEHQNYFQEMMVSTETTAGPSGAPRGLAIARRGPFSFPGFQLSHI
jgi:hypothetical protein